MYTHEERLAEALRSKERALTDPRVFLKKMWNSHAGMHPGSGTCFCGTVFAEDPEILKSWHTTALAFHEHLMEVLLQHPVVNERIEGIVKTHEGWAWAEGFEAGATFREDNPGPSGIPIDPPRNPYVED